jgi:hypothetical protein
VLVEKLKIRYSYLNCIVMLQYINFNCKLCKALYNILLLFVVWDEAEPVEMLLFQSGGCSLQFQTEKVMCQKLTIFSDICKESGDMLRRGTWEVTHHQLQRVSAVKVCVISDADYKSVSFGSLK